jgi:hypothetical protein
MDNLVSLRRAAYAYKTAKTKRQLRQSLMLYFDVLMDFAEKHGAELEDLAPARDAINAINALDAGSKNSLFEATGKRIGLENYGRRAWLSAGMEWLKRSGLDIEKAARETLRLAKVRNITHDQLIRWREDLMAQPSEGDGVELQLARQRFVRLTNPDNWIGRGFDSPQAIAKRILQTQVGEIPK